MKLITEEKNLIRALIEYRDALIDTGLSRAQADEKVIDCFVQLITESIAELEK